MSFTNNQPNIDTLSLQLISLGAKVLDVGCGNGRLGKFMKKKLKCQVVGVDSNQKLVKNARKINKTIYGNIENPKVFAKAAKYGPYDIIFASAILEHLVNPENMAMKLSRLLKNDGFMIITLPNVTHWTSRLSICLGKFDYQNSGIFDRTHLHFYTIKTAREFLNKCRLIVEQYDYELTEFPILHRIFKLFPGGKQLQYRFYKSFPSFFAYQMVFKVKPI